MGLCEARLTEPADGSSWRCMLPRDHDGWPSDVPHYHSWGRDMLSPLGAEVSDETRGLYRKYNVSRVDGKPMVGCFVLSYTDPLAVAALVSYAYSAREAGNVALADDLERVIRAMKALYGEEVVGE